jgi:LysR family transcriptional regulator, benzoate and cis,cis-muconate-responsive activator of ben and cat genes
MDLREMRYFLAVAEEKNLGRAAVRLHISQPPLTRQIQGLEGKLGTQLFRRTPKGVELTDAGQVLLDEVPNLLAAGRSGTAGAIGCGHFWFGHLGHHSASVGAFSR